MYTRPFLRLERSDKNRQPSEYRLIVSRRTWVNRA